VVHDGGPGLSRYSSFGRHFSRTQLLQAVAEILEHFLRPNDVVVDYSCGANEFVPLVKRCAHRAGFKVGGCSVMLFRCWTTSPLRGWYDT
jgi:hypothetical protein